MKVPVSALAIAGLIFLGNAHLVSAQAPQERDSAFVSALGGVWNRGDDSYRAVRASAAAKPSPEVFIEVGGSILWRPEPNGDLATQHTVRIGAFREFADSAGTARPFLGVSLELGVGDLEGGHLNGHFGVRQRLAGDLGLRLEAVGYALWGLGYELLAGLYLNL